MTEPSEIAQRERENLLRDMHGRWHHMPGSSYAWDGCGIDGCQFFISAEFALFSQSQLAEMAKALADAARVAAVERLIDPASMLGISSCGRGPMFTEAQIRRVLALAPPLGDETPGDAGMCQPVPGGSAETISGLRLGFTRWGDAQPRVVAKIRRSLAAIREADERTTL